MKLTLIKNILPFALFLLTLSAGGATPAKLKFNKQVHDFGQILISNGPVKCAFTATNTSNQTIVIQSVTTTCGCTVASWTHDPIQPGQTAKVSVTYSNDEGPYPFDKTLTVKLVGEQTPILLHIRGISQEKIKADKDVYTTVFGGTLGMLTDEFKTLNIEQGNSRQDQTTIANLSASPLKISFTGVSESLAIEVKPNPAPAHAHATLYYTISSKQGVWGWNNYQATVNINGQSSGKTVKFRAFTAENFSSLTKEQKSLGSRPVFKESTFSFGHKKKGTIIDAKFFCENKGKSTLKIYKVDADHQGLTPGQFKDIEPGNSDYFTIRMDTKNLPCGEALIIVTLTTNSPLRPVVNLFLAGWID